ncbi:MAG TPA: hypothetical protein VN476_03470 [Pyrinomonadaceae bacterium]|nr:hypothetical protein [Pyrinomonadaceae bacterium]
MDKVDVARTAQTRIAHLGVADSGWWLPNIVKQVPTAMQTVAQSIASSPEKNVLTTTFTVTLSGSGDTTVGSLTAAITAAEPIILIPPFVSVREATGKEYKYQETRNQLDTQDMANGDCYYFVQGTSLIARKVTAGPTTLLVVASYVPTPENFPNQFKDNVVAALVALMLGSLAGNK